MHLLRKSHGHHEIWNYLVPKCSFCHNLKGASDQKTYLTKVVKEIFSYEVKYYVDH